MSFNGVNWNYSKSFSYNMKHSADGAGSAGDAGSAGSLGGMMGARVGSTYDAGSAGSTTSCGSLEEPKKETIKTIPSQTLVLRGDEQRNLGKKVKDYLSGVGITEENCANYSKVKAIVSRAISPTYNKFYNALRGGLQDGIVMNTSYVFPELKVE